VHEGFAAVVESMGPGEKSVTVDVVRLPDKASPKAEPARARVAATSWACIVAGGGVVGIELVVDGWMYELMKGDTLMEMQLQMVDDVREGKKKDSEREKKKKRASDEEPCCWQEATGLRQATELLLATAEMKARQEPAASRGRDRCGTS
jgi:hypothetical protein